MICNAKDSTPQLSSYFFLLALLIITLPSAIGAMEKKPTIINKRVSISQEESLWIQLCNHDNKKLTLPSIIFSYSELLTSSKKDFPQSGTQDNPIELMIDKQHRLKTIKGFIRLFNKFINKSITKDYAHCMHSLSLYNSLEPFLSYCALASYLSMPVFEDVCANRLAKLFTTSTLRCPRIVLWAQRANNFLYSLNTPCPSKLINKILSPLLGKIYFKKNPTLDFDDNDKKLFNTTHRIKDDNFNDPKEQAYKEECKKIRATIPEELRHHSCKTIEFHPNGNQAFSTKIIGDSSNRLRIWHKDDGGVWHSEIIQESIASNYDTLLLNSDGLLLLTTARVGNQTHIICYDTITMQVHHTFKLREISIFTFIQNLENNSFILYSKNNEIYFLDMDAGIITVQDHYKFLNKNNEKYKYKFFNKNKQHVSPYAYDIIHDYTDGKKSMFNNYLEYGADYSLLMFRHIKKLKLHKHNIGINVKDDRIFSPHLSYQQAYFDHEGNFYRAHYSQWDQEKKLCGVAKRPCTYGQKFNTGDLISFLDQCCSLTLVQLVALATYCKGCCCSAHNQDEIDPAIKKVMNTLPEFLKESMNYTP